MPIRKHLIAALALPLAACGGQPAQTPKVASGADEGPQVAEAKLAPPKPSYTLKTPDRWQRVVKGALTQGGLETFTSPEGTVHLHIFEGKAAEGAEALSGLIDTSRATVTTQRAKTPVVPELKERQRVDGGSNNQFSEQLVVTWTDDASTYVSQGIAMRHKERPETAYVVVIEGDIKTVQKRQAELLQILTSMKIEGITEVKLTAADLKPFTEEKQAKFFKYVDTARQMTGVQGVSVAVITPEGVFTRGFGTTVEGGEAVTPKTRFMIGSITKSFSTLLLATLVDEGKLRWEMPVTEAKSDFTLADARGAALQIQHLFCACVGAPRQDMEMLFQFGDKQPADIFGEVAQLKLTTDLGETFQYNNQLTAAGGYIAGQVTFPEMKDPGAAYARALRTRVLDPLGMGDTVIDQEGLGSKAHAMPHRMDWSGRSDVLPMSMETFVDPYAPAGALWSTADDMVKYLQLQLARGVAPSGKRVVSEANLRRTQTSQVKVHDTAGYGMGWIEGTYKGLRVVGHGGATMGFNSDLLFFPDLGVGFFVVANRSPAMLHGAVKTRLLELLFDQPEEIEGKLTQELFQTQRLLNEQSSKVSKAPFPDALLGTYHSPRLGPLKVSRVKDAVMMDAGEWSGTLAVYSPEDRADTVIITSGVMQGMLLYHGQVDGVPTLTLKHSQSDYVFTQKASHRD
ncbi:MAG: serine hydrolase domain-containing protein [Bradymonadia bacterium]